MHQAEIKADIIFAFTDGFLRSLLECVFVIWVIFQISKITI